MNSLIKSKYNILGIVALFGLSAASIINPDIFPFFMGFVIGIILGAKAATEKVETDGDGRKCYNIIFGPVR